MQIKIRYFADLKDLTKKGEEIMFIDNKNNSIDTNIIKEKICEKYGIKKEDIFKIAINGILDKEIIKDGDIVSFHPIYRGG